MRIVYISLLVFVCVKINAQTSLDSKLKENLHFQALAVAIDSSESYYSNIESRRKNYPKIIIRDNFIFDSLPSKIAGHSVEYLREYEIRKKYLKSKKTEVPVIELRPASNKADTLVFSFVDYWISYGKVGKGYGFGLEGGTIVEFFYDCEKQSYIVNKVSFWGI